MKNSEIKDYIKDIVLGTLLLVGLFGILTTFGSTGIKILAIIGWGSILYYFYQGRSEEEILHDKIFTNDEYYYGNKNNKR